MGNKTHNHRNSLKDFFNKQLFGKKSPNVGDHIYHNQTPHLNNQLLAHQQHNLAQQQQKLHLQQQNHQQQQHQQHHHNHHHQQHQMLPQTNMHIPVQVNSQQVVYHQHCPMPITNLAHHQQSIQVQPNPHLNHQNLPQNQFGHIIPTAQQSLVCSIPNQQFAARSAADLRTFNNHHDLNQQHQQSQQTQHQQQHNQQPQQQQQQQHHQPMTVQSQPHLLPHNECLYQNNPPVIHQQQQLIVNQQLQQHSHQQHQPLQNDPRPPRYAEDQYYNTSLQVVMPNQQHQIMAQQHQGQQQNQSQQQQYANHIPLQHLHIQNATQQMAMIQESSGIINPKTNFIGNDTNVAHQPSYQNHIQNQQYQNTQVMDNIEQEEAFSLETLIIMYDRSREDLKSRADFLQKDLDTMTKEIELIRKKSPSNKIDRMEEIFI